MDLTIYTYILSITILPSPPTLNYPPSTHRLLFLFTHFLLGWVDPYHTELVLLHIHHGPSITLLLSPRTVPTREGPSHTTSLLYILLYYTYSLLGMIGSYYSQATSLLYLGILSFYYYLLTHILLPMVVTHILLQYYTYYCVLLTI